MPANAAPLERSHASRRIDRVALAGLGVAALGMIATLAGSVLQFRSADDPYRQLVYQQQVEQAMAVVGYIQAASDDLERWQATMHSKQTDPLSPERRERMINFLLLSDRMWLLPDGARSAVDREAHSYSVYVVNCAVASYRAAVMPTQCHDAWYKLKNNLGRTKDDILRSVKMKTRLQS